MAYKLDEYPFSRLSFSNVDFVCNLEIWRSFGEEGLKDASINLFYSAQTDEWTNEKYENLPAKICLDFYDILI